MICGWKVVYELLALPVGDYTIHRLHSCPGTSIVWFWAFNHIAFLVLTMSSQMIAAVHHVFVSTTLTACNIFPVGHCGFLVDAASFYNVYAAVTQGVSALPLSNMLGLSGAGHTSRPTNHCHMIRTPSCVSVTEVATELPRLQENDVPRAYHGV
jgi:hypothetical protein